MLDKLLRVDYLKGIGVITIMAVSGHKTIKSFMTYIKATGEEHARIMKTFWDNEKENTSKKEKD